MAFKFENLRVWQLSLDFATEVSNTINQFPKHEQFGLSSQFQRAADSVCLNVAEGSTGQSNKEFSKFLGYSIRSAIECVTCLHLALRRNYISKEKFQNQYEFLEGLIRQIQALRNSLN